MKKLYFSAYQAYLFNRILDRRRETAGNEHGKLFAGDLAWLHRNGAVFRVLEPEREQPRADSFEISPSGPIFGMKMLHAAGLEGEIESEVLRREGITATDFHRLMPHLRLEGGRRPFRARIEELDWKAEGSDLVLDRSSLPRGSYATTVLREIMKADEVPEAYYEDGEEERHGLWRPSAMGAAGAVACLPCIHRSGLLATRLDRFPEQSLPKAPIDP